MSKLKICVGTENKKAIEFFSDYFGETQSVPSIIRSKADVGAIFTGTPDMIFIEGGWVDNRLVESLTDMKHKNRDLKCFQLGYVSSPESFQFLGKVELPIDEKAFHKVVLPHMQYPERIKVLVVDDEREVCEMIKEYFEFRIKPAFHVRSAQNGLEGFKLIEQETPDCLILDIKMPVKTGVELYRDLIRSGRKILTIIFIDSTSSEDILEIRKWGSPIFVEKGGHYSSMSEMISLIKKLIAFS
ncbi:MAG: hypothetical protein A3G33_04460 [Omnitrophica bacterium RIFCSPLOWO2_12_FULL_44_17]|uniref:Response regulatory domain-containing protein n=1 Tax=Candidatus Danuiimicrobium aquiferis TaxID=1801832 RepID=A0A1G1KQI9_9BACT|nr:MAG: hypothetical protein A3B72_10670 [Omnitrophica bacterium RIFCSPHIGHO2_02_FULL_45_28]OGW92292.1 MAG: hypothetical protein A3E74_09480 [Omnitrophica bacterium RIFCSPHIGHO2_12_FULL_44_12]OGW95187.1 MAG: hypothetical protein A3G33_04460 [Omnitrophica bacterium RIFCSPLOWO2_12_FULL_44_17]OGX01668.1 MAG: hypothetical protein A3J12_03975 [Omnitrophica bacterium RIFCSPLOWO2_02_FULL_44_11]